MNVFDGSMDQDSAPERVGQGDFYGAKNMSNSALLMPGAETALISSLGISYTFPSGISQIMGGFEDRQTQSIVLFFYNTANNHRIISIRDKDNLVTTIAGGPGLNLDSERRIHSGKVIDGKLLYWVDGFTDGKTFWGEQLRKINIEKSYTGSDKLLSYEMYAGLPEANQWADGSEYTLQIVEGVTVVFEVTYTLSVDTYENEPQAGLEWLYSQMEPDFEDFVAFDLCPCKLSLTMKTEGRLVFTTDDTQILFVPENHYVYPSTDIKYQHTTMAKYPPMCAPTPSYISSPDIEYNNVRNFCGQFRTRYIYDDGEASAWSAVSVIPLNNNQISLNAIRIDFTDERLSDPEWLCIIRSVEVAYRDGNEDIFRLIERIPICEIGTGTNYIDFFNDQLYSAIPSDDTSISDLSVQVIMNDSGVPRGACTIETVSDESGDTRIVAGGILRGYDCPDCIDADFPTETYSNDCLVDIIGTVSVFNDPSYPDDDPNYPNYQLGGFVVYLAGTRHFAISNNPADGTGDGSFIIRNVPLGKYALRVASYMVRYGSDLGDQLNLLNGIEWQKTSSPCYDVAGSFAAQGIRSERLLDLTTFPGTTFDLDSEVGYGDISIQNAHHTFRGEGPVYGALFEAYIMDNNGLYETVEDRVLALNVENQQVRFYIINETGYNETYVESNCDHNGYAFAWLDTMSDGPGVRLFLPNTEAFLPSGIMPYNAPNVNLYRAQYWKEIQDDDQVDLYDPAGSLGWAWNFVTFVIDPLIEIIPYHFYVYIRDPAWALANKFSITSSVDDINGSPVANALIWMGQNGRTARTNPLGEFTLTMFSYRGVAELGDEQNIYATYEEDSCADFPVDPVVVGGDALPITVSDPAFVFGFAGGIIPEGRFLKSGGIYKVGVVYEDDFGRTCGVVPWGTVHIPFHTQDGIFAQRRMRFEINSRPPVWATRYRIVRTRDGYYQNYAQLPVADAIYVVIPDNYESPNPTSFESGSATHILLQIGVNQSNLPATTQTLLMFQENNPDGYRAKLGDRVRYLLDENQDTVINGDILDVNVVGEYIDGDKYYVVITYDNINKQIMPNWVFEFYTPKGVQEEIYYETGVCLPILNPGTGTQYHKGIDQDQTSVLSQPATGEILSGDTYWYMRDYILYGGAGYTFTPENPKIRLLDTMECEDIGRAFVYDPFAKEQFLYNNILISGIYVPNTEINNLSVFGSLDFIKINRTFGPIRKLVQVNSLLLAIAEFKTQPIYVSKDMVIDLSGSSIVGRSAALLNVADEVIADAGTYHPESVVVQDGQVWWWDTRNATVWRYSQAGVQDMRRKMVGYFRTVARTRKILDRKDDVVVAGYDRRYGHLYLTFTTGETNREEVGGKSIVFTESSDGWGFEYDPLPELYIPVSNNLYMVSDGTPLIHKMYSGAGFLKFFGTQYEGEITFVTNDKPFTIKDWHNLRVFATKNVYSPEVYIYPCVAYPSGMYSRIPQRYWKSHENQLYALFLRDYTDPHTVFTSIANVTVRQSRALLTGRYLKGGVARIKLRISTPFSGNSIKFADVEVTSSNITR